MFSYVFDLDPAAKFSKEVLQWCYVGDTWASVDMTGAVPKFFFCELWEKEKISKVASL